MKPLELFDPEKNFPMEVILFMPPMGESRREWIIMPLECKDKYDLLSKLGCRITLDPLRATRETCIAIEDPNWGDFDCIIVRNGDPDEIVTPMLVDMINKFDRKPFYDWRRTKGWKKSR